MAQDEYSNAEQDIKANQFEFKTEQGCLYKRPNHFVLIGYSAGGDAASRVANDLNSPQLRPIDLGFTIDPVHVIRGLISNWVYKLNPSNFGAVPGNVLRWVNYYQHLDTTTFKVLYLGRHGIWGGSMPGADIDQELNVNAFARNFSDVPAKFAADNGHLFIPEVTFIMNRWLRELGKVVAVADAAPWKLVGPAP